MTERYTPIEWQNRIVDADGTVVQEGTPLSAENLNRIEQGIAQLSELPEVLENTKQKVGQHTQEIEGLNRSVEDLSDDMASVQQSIGAPNGIAELDENRLIKRHQLPVNLNAIRVVGDIAARDQLETYEGLRVLVTDATADTTVGSGWAEYVFDGEQFIKTAEGEQLDVVLRWGDIEDKPSQYPSAPHTHTEAQIIDLDKYTQKQVDDLLATIRTLINNHLNDKENPHVVTKTQIGLDNVANHAVASQAQAEAGVSNNHAMTPLRAMQLLQKWATDNLATIQQNGLMSATDKAQLIKAVEDVASLLLHAQNTENPHAVTKAQVGLSSVQNYAIASQANAEAGTSNALYMTPLRVKNAIDKFVPKALSGFTNDTNFISSNAAKITVSTTAPTSPNVNDIWIKT